MKTQGFTLIELMVVVAIIGILSTASMSMYTQYVQKGHRNTTQADLLSIERLQENYHMKNFAYTDNLSDLGFDDPTIIGKYTVTAQVCKKSPGENPDPYADIDTSSANKGLDLCYMLVATPNGAQAEDGSFLMDNRGRRQYTNASGKKEDWQGNSSS